MIDRRRFLMTSFACVLASRLTADAQPTGKVYRVGWLSIGAPYWKDSPLAEAFRQSLREQGWREGQNLTIEYRWAHDDPRRLPGLAKELVELPVDVIFAAGSNIAAAAAKDATRTTPIVMEGVTDPVGSGLITSFAHPSGNVTGLATLNVELGPKLVELLTQIRPKVSRIAILRSSAHRPSDASAEAAVQAAGASGLTAWILTYESFEDIRRELATQKETTGAVVLGGPLAQIYAARLADLTLKHRLPTITPHRDFAEAGGLMAYGQNKSEEFRRAAAYVAKILRGVKPEDLPVEEAARFEFVINLKTARALGLTIPKSLLLRADQVIE
jgi:putative tryptophan/tyrosine transport system substrate-binding protein